MSSVRALLVLGVVIACAAAALHDTPRRALAYPPLPQPPAFAARCVLRGEQARAHAKALERRSMLRWERAPFAALEGARAQQLIAEAEVCYRAAGDLSGAQRAASLHRRYAAESARREAAQRVAELQELP